MLQTGNVGIGEFKDKSEKARFVSTKTFESLSCKDVFPGDILISRLPDPVGRACVVPNLNVRSITAVDCTIVRFADELVVPDFFVYFSQSDGYLKSVSELCTGATRSRISRSSLGKISIPVPPLDEQKRIVAMLDQVFSALGYARANAETNMADARALFNAELQAQFESAGRQKGRLPFDSVCEPLTPRVKLKRQDYLEDGKYPVVSQEADLISGYWNDGAALIGAEGPVVVFGDHTCCLKYVDFDFVVGADGTKVLQPFSGISAKFLYYGLRSQTIQKNGYARHFRLLRETTLPALPMPEQKRLINRLDQLEAESAELAKAYETKLIEIENLRQSLLQAAFSGQLT